MATRRPLSKTDTETDTQTDRHARTHLAVNRQSSHPLGMYAPTVFTTTDDSLYPNLYYPRIFNRQQRTRLVGTLCLFTIREVILSKVYCSYLYVQTILEIFPSKPKSRVVPSGYSLRLHNIWVLRVLKGICGVW